MQLAQPTIWQPVIASDWGELVVMIAMSFGGVVALTAFLVWLGNRLYRVCQPRHPLMGWMLAVSLPVAPPFGTYVVTSVFELGPFDPEVWLAIAVTNLVVSLIVRAVSGSRARQSVSASPAAGKHSDPGTP